MTGMAPFIKYTYAEETKTGKVKQTRFINAAQIAQATFYDDTGHVHITLAGLSEPLNHELEGQEALKALKTLESL